MSSHIYYNKLQKRPAAISCPGVSVNNPLISHALVRVVTNQFAQPIAVREGHEPRHGRASSKTAVPYRHTAAIDAKIVARENISAMRKDVIVRAKRPCQAIFDCREGVFLGAIFSCSFAHKYCSDIHMKATSDQGSFPLSLSAFRWAPTALITYHARSLNRRKTSHLCANILLSSSY